MLAKLLRTAIAIQVLLGAGLGFGVAVWQGWPLWVTLMGGLALPFATMVLVDTYSAIVSRGNEPWGMWVRSLLGEYRAGFITFLFRQPWTLNPPGLLPAIAPQKRVPVVLVHGYMCNHRIWDDVANALRAQGHDVFAVDLEPLFTSIDNYAPTLESAVQALMAHSGQQRVAIVGHSMGGLATRAWLRAYGSSRVVRVITLGTPHQGTQIPQHIPTPNGVQMAWGSDWLKQLAAQESDATRSLFCIALTPQDNIVYPQRAQVLLGLVPHVFEGLGHVQMCVDPHVVAWVQRQLADLSD